MAKSSSRHPSGPTQGRNSLANRKSNAVGFAKRQERKVKGAIGISDIYEYSSGSNKRSKVSMDFSHEELNDMGKPSLSDSDAADDAKEDNVKKFNTGIDDDGVVNSEDDEEIESDDAFEGESDEERFTGFKFREQPRQRKPVGKLLRSSVDLNEDDAGDDRGISEDEGDEDSEAGSQEEEMNGMIDLSHMLDLPEHDRSNEEKGEDESSGGESETDEDVLAPSDEEQDGNLEALNNFVESLESKKRKAEGETELPRKRRLLHDRTEAGPEGEFAAPAPSSKLRVEDLITPLASSGSNPSSLLSLKKSVKALAATTRKTQPLQAPLPTRVQDRLDREAAYEQTKKEVEKWEPTMRRIRNAEHLSFPLQAPVSETASTAQLTAKFKPSNDMESAVDQLLKSAKLREEDITKTEDLQMKELTVEEVKARRAELRHSRELMFRAEIKAHRVAKIKSRAFRRIHRKFGGKNQLDLDELEKIDPDMADAERMKAEAERARERATLRHKNGGQWVRKMKGTEGDADKRRDLMEMLERGDQLRKKVAGEADEDMDGSASEDDGDEDVDAIKRRAYDELATLDKELATTSVIPSKSGVFGMKFMQDAESRKMANANKLADDFRQELGEDSEGHEDVANDVTNTVTNGRFIYQPSGFASAKPSEFLPPLAKPIRYQASETSTIKSSDHGLNTSPKELQNEVPTSDTHAPASPDTSSSFNPWLSGRPEVLASTSKLSRKSNNVILSKDSNLAVKSKNALKKQQSKSEAAKAKEREDGVVEISLDDVMVLAPTTSPVMAKKPARNSKGKGKDETAVTAVVDVALQDSDDEAGSDVETPKTRNPNALQQRDLVALAFAGDNVVEEFAERKRKEIEENAPREEDHTLPGWGNWTGKGLPKAKPNPKFIKKIPGVDPTKRSDFGKSHVIISEKKDKKASKYMVKDLPFPYTSRAQYERSLEVPLGTEWNTRIGFQKGTLPKVVKKMGTVINPLERLF